ncbi:MAG: pilus assembly protein N-terminal domain-containing protein [Candidatus Eisenbacteria bacterium]
MRRALTGFGLIAAIVLAGVPIPAMEAPAPGSIIEVVERQSKVVEFDFDVETVSITDPEMADVILVTPRQILVHGKEVGKTSLIVWDAFQAYYDYQLKVISAKTNEQILLRVRVAEVNRDRLSELGIDWLVFDRSDKVVEGDKTIGSFAGSVQPPSDPLSLGEGVTGLVKYVGKEERITSIIHALEEKGGLNLLAKPDLICLNGEEANFLVGGEIPIPISQSVTVGAAFFTIDWKEFGVRLGFTPTVVGENLVRLAVEPEVSSLDYSNAITFSGFNIPAIRTRRAKTTVELHDGETFIIGGLLNTTETELVSRVPILGSIPLLGMLFSNTSKQLSETELMILISPTIVEPIGAGEIPELPWTPKERE